MLLSNKEEVVFQQTCKLFRMRSTNHWTQKGNKCKLILKIDSKSDRLQITAWDSDVKTIVLNGDASASIEPSRHHTNKKQHY